MPKTGRTFFRWKWWSRMTSSKDAISENSSSPGESRADATQPRTHSQQQPPLGADVVALAERVEKLEQELKTYRALEQTRRDGADNLRETLDKSIDDKLQAQSSRIGDISGQIDRFGTHLMTWGITLSLMFTLAGLLVYKNARDDAKQQVEDWLKVNFEDIVRQVKDQAEKELKQYIDGLKKRRRNLIIM